MSKRSRWIQKAIRKPGALHKDLGVPEGEPIPVGALKEAAKGNSRTAKRARLAMTLRKFSKHFQKGVRRK
jgi:hypothetical protein